MPIDYGSNNVSTSGVVTATSGNFTSLTINNSEVPVGSGSSNYSATWISVNTLGTGILYDNGTNVGIGTNNPQTFVHISGDFPTVGNILRLQNNNSSQKTYVDFRIGSSGNFEDHFFIRRSGVDIFGIDTNNRGFFPSNCVISATKQFQSYNNANAFLEFQQAASPASAANFRLGYLSDANMIFLASYVERMRLTGSGNLGIGTTSPSGQLHVIGNAIVSSGLTAATGNFTTSISGALLNIDNIRIDGNTITSTNSNGNLIIQTTGTGPLQRTTTGNTRGNYAVDLQSNRASNGQVASGSNSVIGGGKDNTSSGNYSNVDGGRSCAASGDYSTVGGGYKNTIDNMQVGSTICGGENNSISGIYTDRCTIGGGSSNSVSGNYTDRCTIGGGYDNSVSGYGSSTSTIGGGSSNSVSGNYSGSSTIGGGNSNSVSGNSSSNSTIGGGSSNSISGNSSSYSTIGGGNFNSIGNNAPYSTIPGGLNAKTTRYGELSHAAGSFTNYGDAQHSIFVLRGKTTNASQTTTLGLNGSTTSRLTIASGEILSGTINIVGSISTGANVARYYRQFSIKRVGNTTSLVGSIITLGTDEAAGTSISITADDTNEALQIEVTRSANETWRWVAVVDAVSMVYGA